jgi:hypothetical protein
VIPIHHHSTKMNYIHANLFILPIGIGSSILFYLSAFVNGRYHPFTNNGAYDTQITILLLISFLYFLLDFIFLVIRYQRKNRIYFLHHIIGIISIPLIYYRYYYLVKYLLAYLTYEISTPFLHLSIYYHQLGSANVFTRIVDLIFFFTYTIIRIFFGTYLLIKIGPIILSIDGCMRYTIILPIVLQILNYGWYIKIIFALYKQLTK